jgi:hypothetical protein
MGEAAFLSKHHEDIERSFYKAIPGKNILKCQLVYIILSPSLVLMPLSFVQKLYFGQSS